MSVTQESPQTHAEQPHTYPLDLVEGPHTPGDELAHKLSRIAATHDIRYSYEEELPQDYQVRRNTAQDRLTLLSHALQRGAGMPPPETLNPVSLEEITKRDASLWAVSHQLGLHTLPNVTPADADKPARIDWRGTSLDLLDGFNKVDDPAEREHRLVAAVIAAQFAENDADRIDFLRAVYERGLQAEVAASCRNSNLAIVVDAPQAVWGVGAHDYYQVDNVSHFAAAFEGDQAIVELYTRQLTATPAGRTPRSHRRIAKELVAEEHVGEQAEQLRAEAQDASQHAEKVTSVVTDPLKLERFALQMLLIRDQTPYLFGSTKEELADSPLSQKLRELRNTKRIVYEPGTEPSANVLTPDEQLEQDVAKLVADIQKAYTELSKPVLEQYSLDGVDSSDPALMTREQRRAARFREVTRQMSQGQGVSRFINMQEFVERSDIEQAAVAEMSDIGEISSDGAGLVTNMESMLPIIVKAATAYARKEGVVPPTPEELYAAVNAHRSVPLYIASHNISELASASDERHISDKVTFKRIDGKLQMKLLSNIPKKGSLDVYAAATLGCPALNINHNDRAALDMAQRMALGSANVVDHGIAAVYKEAYERGIFDISKYGGASAPLAAA